MACKFQQSEPELMNLFDKSKEPLVRCGIDDPNKAGYARNCLLARRLLGRGLLDDTIVNLGGEFGRTHDGAGGNDVRDHHSRAFSMRLAGGAIKAGHVHGKTDDFGFNVDEDVVHVHDLNATLLHLLGFDHTRLTE